ncbi:MAG: isocitrate/isopropylmalate family dehydrogenase, partial [Gammaproteobacteria bacterium]|nr:isocitrate/isopropylmalate family dehydrogenase [Gammaproteobacteria bacterium]
LGMLPSASQGAEADLLENAVEVVLASGKRTPDILQPGREAIPTAAMGDAVLAELDRLGG